MPNYTPERVPNGVPYGIHDRPGVPGELPILPVMQSPVQLSTSEPPVDDPDFEPSSLPELATAASVLARRVPFEQIRFYYHNLVRLGDEAENRQYVEDDMSMVMDESSLRRAIRGILSEGRPLKGGGLGIGSGDGDAAGGGDADAGREGDDEAILGRIASEFGYKSPSGARQEIHRLLARVKMYSAISEKDIAETTKFAAGQFVDILRREDLIDDDERKELGNVIKSSPNDLTSLFPSFRVFFVSAFVYPAFTAGINSAKKTLNSYLSSQGVDSNLVRDSFTHQLFGESEKNFDYLAKKSGLPVDRVKTMFAAGDRIVKKAMEEIDMMSIAKSRWESMSDDKKAKLALSALESSFADDEPAK